jgi:hypothetical protein
VGSLRYKHCKAGGIVCLGLKGRQLGFHQIVRDIFLCLSFSLSHYLFLVEEPTNETRAFHLANSCFFSTLSLFRQDETPGDASQHLHSD